MKKVLVAIALLVVVGALAVYVRKYVGDLRPSFLPSGKKLTTLIEQNNTEPTDASTGEAVEFPLRLPEGYEIGVFSAGTDGARDLEFSPGGTLLVSLQKRGMVVALPDKNKDGVADEEVEVLGALSNPHGIAFGRGKYANSLFIATENAVTRYQWIEETLDVVRGHEIVRLPAGGRHVTRSLAFDRDGRLFVSIGSTCDTCFEKDPMLATVIVTDGDGNNQRVFSKGLRNAVFIAQNPASNEIWATEMGRDFLGDENPPDEIDILKDGADYGWPVCYGDKVYDRSFNQKNTSYCENTIAPIFKIPAHSAPLGLTFINSPQMSQWQGDLLVAYHGSWNRSEPTGYKIVRMDVEGSQITGATDFISGFLKGAQALGRPVDMVFDRDGSLFISDDRAGAVYKVVKK